VSSVKENTEPLLVAWLTEATLYLGTGEEPAESFWVWISRQTNMGNVVGVCCRHCDSLMTWMRRQSVPSVSMQMTQNCE